MNIGYKHITLALVTYLNSGYMAPEYAMRGIFSAKSDVYSFGVLTLEVVSGVKISSTNQKDEDENLIVTVSTSIAEFPNNR